MTDQHSIKTKSLPNTRECLCKPCAINQHQFYTTAAFLAQQSPGHVQNFWIKTEQQSLSLTHTVDFSIPVVPQTREKTVNVLSSLDTHRFARYVVVTFAGSIAVIAGRMAAKLVGQPRTISKTHPQTVFQPPIQQNSTSNSSPNCIVSALPPIQQSQGR